MSLKIINRMNICGLLVVLIVLAGASHAFGAASAGYSEYYIPGDEEFMLDIFEECGTGGQGNNNHVTITVTAWSDNSMVYYDHWEDGYSFDPDDPDTADETYTLTNRGDSVSFESSNVPANPRGSSEYYDGRDYVYVAGGLTTLCRASWTETEGPNQSLAWEVYPVRPQLTKYILPFGEDLDTGDGLDDFERVYALIQATVDNTTITIDYDGDGTADPVDLDRDEDCSDSVTSFTLDEGEVFLLDNHSLCPNTQTVTTGTIILGTETLQVQYVIGDQGTNFEIRGLSAFPRGYWDKEYYAPADGGAGTFYTDLYLHNPWDSALTVNYETSSATGSLTIPANDTVSFGATEGFVPQNTSVYLSANSEFWGVSTIDYEGITYDWGYALVPAYLLDYEHFMGWAPSSYPVTAGYYANSGIYIAPAMDNIRVFVDVDSDMAADQTYDLNRLETQYIYDSADGDLSDTNVWATGPYSLVYGEDLDGSTSNPALDVGYTTIPGVSFIELVLTVDKTVDPVMVATSSGEQSDFTLVVNSHEFEVDDINVVDFMPGGWKYVDDSTTITLADMSTISGNSADPDYVSYRDDFNGSVYNNNSDNLPSGTTWDTDWREESDDASASGGEILIATDTGVTPNATSLRFTDADSAIARRADLSGYTEAMLHFDYRRTLLDAADDYIVCQVCADSADASPITCGSGWTNVVTIGGTTNDSEYQHYEVDLTRILSGVNSANFAIRFTSTGVGGDLDPGDYIYIDNVQVETPLIWDDTLLGSMDPNQEITITFTAETVHAFNLGDITRNVVEATGTRTVGDPPVTQTFTASDFAFNGFGDFEIDKTTGGVDPLFPGDQYTYTVEVTNNESTDTLTGIAIYDAMPEGVSYVADSSEVTGTGNPIRVTEYFISSGNFTGTTYNLTLNQDLASDYFVIVRGGAEGNATRGPDDNYPALTSDPWGTGDLTASSGDDVIGLTRGGTSDDWVGVVTVVESLGDADNGFTLLDVQRVAHTGTGTSGTDTSGTAWSDIDDVVLMGGFNGAGCNTSETSSARHISCFARIWPSGTDTINWSRDGTGGTLGTATSTVMVIEWGTDWTVQRVNVTGNNGGNGANATGEYNTGSISSVARANTWVWGTGHTNDEGIGDGAEGVLVTLGNGVAQNLNETTVAVGMEYNNNAMDFEVYALTHDDLAVDYRFKVDGDSGANTVDVTVDAATSNRMALAYNGSNGTGTAYPRPIFSARYTANTTVRLERGFNGQNFPAWVQGIDFSGLSGTITASANDPPNFVATGDGYDLAPGETLTLTFDVTIDDPLAGGIEEIINTAWASCAEIPLPISDDATNIVTNPTSNTADVGDRVWLDSDGDGVDDVGEPGLGDVEVTLKDEWGTPIATTTTDSTGRYLFTDVEPGDDYYVEVTGGLPAGLTQTAPSGHSDDRTDPFDLAAGDEYLDADLGYTPDTGTATFGDLVWSDADGDGVRDAGEPGLEGITVELYLDDGDGVFDSGDTQVTTTTTAAGGGYLITNITPSGGYDYYVYVDPSQTALSGYSGTTSNPFVNWNVSAGDVLINNDFGFQNSTGTYSIDDRVWLDVDADENDDVVAGDNGESGIAGVTVDLLDDSLNVIATTVTDADGYFSFNGVPGGGADYTVRITDTDGLLDDYYGTTAEAVAGEMAITNLTGDLDYTTEPTEPNFGYNLARTIGDFVWNDLDGDGVQDSGELGIGGVTVELYLDINGNGTYDVGTDTLQDTQTTGAAGDYLFSGLSAGTYFVHIDNTQAALTGYTLTTTDDEAAAGHQQEASISGNSSDLTADFGYQASTPRAASGTVWDDDDEDGTIDGGESLFEDVTVELYLDDGDGVFEPGLGADDGLPIALTTTDANGDYGFSGLVSNDYWVYVTDNYGILNGYETTYEKTEGTTGPYDDAELVDLTSDDVTDVDFGYYKPVATLVVLSSFRAYEDGGQTVVEWETAAEVGTVGFYLKRLDEKAGRYTRVNKRLLPGLLHSQQGGTYRYIDTGAQTGGTYTYKLVEVEAKGKRRRYGPFTVTVGDKGADLVEGESATPDLELLFSRYSRKARKMSDAKKARVKARKEARKAAKTLKSKQGNLKSKQTNQRSKKGNRGSNQDNNGNVAKMAVTEGNLHYLGVEEMANVLGVSADKVKKWVRKGKLSLSNQGQAVAWYPASGDNGIYFYGEAIESIYTNENIYWLQNGKGLKMKVKDKKTKGKYKRRRGPQPASGDETFADTVHVEVDLYGLPAFFDDPEADYWLWDYIYAGYSGLDTKSFTVRTDGASLTGTATLVAYLQGGSESGCGPEEHHAVVSINSTEIGHAYWEGMADYDEPLPDFGQGLLQDGENTVDVRGILDNCDLSIIYVDSFDVTYQRHYRAVDNRLLFRGDGNPVVTVEGFTGSEILVFNVTDPKKPIFVKDTTIDEAYGSYRVSLKPDSPETEYLALTLDASSSPVSLAAYTDSGLTEKETQVDYVVITPEELKAGALDLADYRQGKGLRTMVAELEAIYDAFNFGIASPHAIKKFLSYAYRDWKAAPTYVVLAGEGTYDYKDIEGHGDNMIPALMVSTDYGLFPSDNQYVDVEGDDKVPEMAIGRIPVVTEEELQEHLDKVFAYETSGGAWTKKILMVADDPDEGGDFPADSDDVAALLSGSSYTPDKVYVPDHGIDDAHLLTLAGINNGALIMNFMGHGGVHCMAQPPGNPYKGVLFTWDMPSLTNSDKLPVVAAFTCMVGQFSIPGYDALAEELVLKNGGGAVAMWSPTGLSENHWAKILNEEFFQAALVDGEKIVGKSIVRAMEAYFSRGGEPAMLDIYTLLGDPALELR